MIVVLSFCFSIVGYSYYSVNKNSDLNKLMNESYKNIGYMKCQPFLFENPIGSEKQLERKYQQLPKVQQENTLIL